MHEKRWQVVLDSKQNMAPPRNTKNGHLVMCFFCRYKAATLLHKSQEHLSVDSAQNSSRPTLCFYELSRKHIKTEGSKNSSTS
jgi:hypothetical protein